MHLYRTNPKWPHDKHLHNITRCLHSHITYVTHYNPDIGAPYSATILKWTPCLFANIGPYNKRASLYNKSNDRGKVGDNGS